MVSVIGKPGSDGIQYLSRKVYTYAIWDHVSLLSRGKWLGIFFVLFCWNNESQNSENHQNSTYKFKHDLCEWKSQHCKI